MHGCRLWANTPQWIQGHSAIAGYIPRVGNLSVGVILSLPLTMFFRLTEIDARHGGSGLIRKRNGHEIIPERPLRLFLQIPDAIKLCFARAASRSGGMNRARPWDAGMTLAQGWA